MKAIPLFLAFEVASRLAFAQDAADPMALLRACSLMEHAGRLECLDKLSRDIAPPDRSRGGDNWITSETTSPVNYTPIVTATAFSRGGSLMQLAIHCRGGRTELVVSGPVVSSGGTDYTISYRVNDGQPVQLAGRPAIVWNRCCVPRRCRSPAAVAPRRGSHCRSHVHPIGCRPRRAFFTWRTEYGAGEIGSGVQMATRRC